MALSTSSDDSTPAVGIRRQATCAPTRLRGLEREGRQGWLPGPPRPTLTSDELRERCERLEGALGTLVRLLEEAGILEVAVVSGAVMLGDGAEDLVGRLAVLDRPA